MTEEGGGVSGVWEALSCRVWAGVGSSLVVEPGKGWASCLGCEVQAGAADSLSGTEPLASQMELSSVRFFQIRTGLFFSPIHSFCLLCPHLPGPGSLPASSSRLHPRDPARVVTCARGALGPFLNTRSWDTCPRLLCQDLLYTVHAPPSLAQPRPVSGGSTDPSCLPGQGEG